MINESYISRVPAEWFELSIFFVGFIGLAIVRYANPMYIPFLLGKGMVINKSKDSDSIFVKNDSKSSIFINSCFLLFIAIILKKVFSLSPASAMLYTFVFAFFQVLGWLLFQYIFMNTINGISFLKKRFELNETLALLMFFYLVCFHYIPQPQTALILVFLFALSVLWFKLSSFLNEQLSIFHIILYLCTLEILPILILVKFIIKH